MNRRRCLGSVSLLLLVIAACAEAADPWQELTSASALPTAEAQLKLEDLLRSNPGFHAARFNLGTLLLAQDAAKAAEQLSLATAAADPALAADAWHNLALARWQLGQLDGALQAAEEATKRQPRNATLRDELRRVALIRADEARRAEEAAAKRLALAATRLAEGRVGEPYRATIAVRGGLPPYRVTVQVPVAPAAPAGTPSTAPPAPATTLAVPPLPGEADSTAASPTAPEATPSVPPATNPLPPGLTLAGDGTLSGTPTAAGTFRIPLNLGDMTTETASGTIELVVLPQPAITTTALPEAVIGLPYHATVTCVGLRSPQWSASGLPAGLACSARGEISGTPTQVGLSAVTVTASEPVVPPMAARRADQRLDLAVIDTFAPDANPLPPATAGQPYHHRLGVRGPPQAYRWAAADGQLTVASDGTVGGTPAAAGTVARPATIHAADGRSRDVNISLPVNPRPMIAAGEPLRLQAGQPIDQPLPVTGGTAPFTWSTGDGALPAGVRLDPDGHLRGVAKDPGTATVTAVVVDRWQARTQAPVVVQIDPAAKDDDAKKSADSKPDGKPGDEKPGDDKKGDDKKGDDKKGDQKSGDEKPGEGKPGEQQSADSKPSEGKADSDKSQADKAKADKPGEAESSKNKSTAPGEKNPQSGESKKPGDSASDSAEATAADQAAGLNQMAADRWLDRLPAENRGVLRYQLLDGGQKQPDPATKGKSW